MQSDLSQKPTKKALVAVATIGAIILLAVGYYWFTGDGNSKPSGSTDVASTAPAKKETPAIRHPVPPAPETLGEKAKPLPPLAESDDALREAAGEFIAPKTLERLFNLRNIVRRIVVTVDDLPRKQVGRRYAVAKPVAGKFVVQGSEEHMVLAHENYQRYAPYVALAESVDTSRLVAVYTYFYPLFQQEYRSLGYPDKYFNDRVVETLDDLLEVPEVEEPVKLVQPKVMYQFADPKLEALSAGQKIMLRMGPDNAERIKVKLHEIRQALVSRH